MCDATAAGLCTRAGNTAYDAKSGRDSAEIETELYPSIPVKEGIVEKGEDYLNSSVCNYAGKKGLIKLDMW